MEKEEFLKKLDRINWLHEYIDDFNQFKREHDLYIEVVVAAQNNPEFNEIFNQYKLNNCL